MSRCYLPDNVGVQGATARTLLINGWFKAGPPMHYDPRTLLGRNSLVRCCAVSQSIAVITDLII